MPLSIYLQVFAVVGVVILMCSILRQNQPPDLLHHYPLC